MIRENEALLDRLNIVTDLVVLFLSIVLSYTVRFHIFDSTENHLLLSYYFVVCTGASADLLSYFQHF